MYVGIDPGITGAIAVLDNDGSLLLLEDMPTIARGKGKSIVKRQVNPAALHEILKPWSTSTATLEAVNSRPGQGVASVFSLGDSFGCIRSVLAVLSMSADFVAPQTWKKHYNITSDKEIARAKAIQLYPAASLHRKKDADRAEAILIARFGYEKYRANG